MSDKTEHLISKYLNEKMEISFGSLTVYDHSTVKKIVDFSIEQHFEDILVEYQDYIDFNEEHDRNASKSERIKSFLNHLKQRKG